MSLGSTASYSRDPVARTIPRIFWSAAATGHSEHNKQREDRHAKAKIALPIGVARANGDGTADDKQDEGEQYPGEPDHFSPSNL